MLVPQLPEAMVRDTIAAVFQDPSFNRTSLLQRFGAWLLDLIESILLRIGPSRAPAPVFWLFVALLTVALAIVLFRLAYGFGPITRRARAQAAASAANGAGRDAWRQARALAAQGEFTAAAHALYAALLSAIASFGEVELHESKTSGDYLRDLKRRASPRAQPFRDFARDYEVTIYGLGSCDRDRYERLYGLAQQIATHHG